MSWVQHDRIIFTDIIFTDKGKSPFNSHSEPGGTLEKIKQPKTLIWQQ